MTTLQVEVKEFEDERALHGGVDGLDIVKQILIHAHKLLSPNGSREVWLEVSHLHPSAIKRWVEEEEEGKACQLKVLECILDMSGKERFIRLRLANEILIS